MAAKLTLRLLASVYDQAQSDDPNPATKRYVRGDVFEARNQEEYDRLIGAEAALDPVEAQKREEADLRRRRDALEAERAQLDARLADLPSGDGEDLSKLSRDDLNARASAAGVDDPAGLPNKDAVIAAIQQAESGQG